MIPPELANIPHWINWKPVGTDKKPLDQTGKVANALDPKNWQSLIHAMLKKQPMCCKDTHLVLDEQFNEDHLMEGMIHLLCPKCRSGYHMKIVTPDVGFVLTGDYVVIDGDHEPWITELTDRFTDRTYCEVSPHGGLHIWLRGSIRSCRGNFEVYGTKRWMTVTGLGNDVKIDDINEEDKEWIKKAIKKV
jgi:primase-polymerase (primpol)-like protein